MTKSMDLRHEFINYARNCILSRRPSSKSDFIIGQSAADSYVSFVEVDKLFSYNPEKWKDIRSIFDIDSSERIKEIYLELVGDDKFNMVDNQQPSQYFRSNAIKHYYCFLKAREIILGKTETQHTVVEESPNFYQRNGDQSLQQIFYGAPGTGKSYTINRDTVGEDVIRTTFHPDTDYSTFVGAYKPTTIEEEVMTVIGTMAVPVENADGTHRKESKIVYEFVQQSFLQAYVAAWKKYAEAQDGEPRKQFLVIEEINRGNCAQIFGDLFQLLDRNAQGFSDYPIIADADMKRQLKKAFAGLALADGDSINAMYNGRNVCQEVLEGDILLLPNNLYIWATMNTSDQSLFPIDSAFKRRWDWQYMPISNANLNWAIEVNGNKYEWWQFLEKINEKIGSLTNCEDKKLGYFFCKADSDGVITADTFVGKVIFYLWNDVFKDYEFSDTIFDDGNGGKLTFDKFYMANGKVNLEKIKMFLSNLGIATVIDQNKDNEDGDVGMSGKVTFMVNGNRIKYINQVCYTVIEEYVKLNKALLVQEIIDYWSEYTQYNMSSWIIGNQAKYDSLKEADKKRTYLIKTENNESLWVNTNGWVYQDGPGDIRRFIKAVNEARIGITVEENRE